MKHISLTCISFALAFCLNFSEGRCQSTLLWTPSNLIHVGNITKITESNDGILYALSDSGILTIVGDGRVLQYTPQRPVLNSGESFIDFTLGAQGAILVGIGTNHSAAVLLSTDQGSTWRRIAIPGTYYGPVGIQAFQNGSLFVALGINYGLFHTSDFGNTWDTIKSPAFKEESMGGFSMTTFGRLFHFGSSYAAFSDDNGKNWQSTSSVAFGNPGGPIVNVVSNNSSEIFLCDAGGVFYSSNAGNDWVDRNTGITDLHASGLAMDPSGTLFLSTYTDGAFVSFNKGDSWKQNNLGLENTHIFSLFLDKHNILYAGSVDRIYKTNATLAVRNSPGSSLSIASANPLSSSATITYSVGHSGYVHCSVFDIMGRERAVLVNGNTESGSHEVIFNASNLPNGTYYFRLQQGNQMETKAVIVSH